MNDMQDTTVIAGSKKRQIIISFFLMLLAYAIVTTYALVCGGITEMTFIYGLVAVGPFLGILARQSIKDLYIVEISNQYIKGPSSGIASRTISVKDINKDKTCKQSIWQKINGRYRI